MLTAVRSAAIWLFIGLVTVVQSILFFPFWLLLWPFDRKRRFAHFVATTWGRTLRFLHPAWGITRVGLKGIGAGPYVIVANHQSTIDIAALFQLPLHFKWISKSENFKIPFVGWWMRAAGYIPLARGEKDSIAKCIARAQKWLERGVSVAFFPEGTRSPDGDIRAFKRGAFTLAIAARCPVLPVTLVGTRDVLPRGEWRIPPRVTSTIWVDPPLPVDDLALDDAETLMNRTRDVIVARMQRCR